MPHVILPQQHIPGVRLDHHRGDLGRIETYSRAALLGDLAEGSQDVGGCIGTVCPGYQLQRAVSGPHRIEVDGGFDRSRGVVWWSEVAVPDWIGGSGFISITQNQGRISVICEEDPIPNDGDDIEGIKIVRGWYCIRSDSDKWSHIGGTKNLVVSTGNSVYILLQARDREHVREILSNAKITFVS